MPAAGSGWLHARWRRASAGGQLSGRAGCGLAGRACAARRCKPVAVSRRVGGAAGLRTGRTGRTDSAVANANRWRAHRAGLARAGSSAARSRARALRGAGRGRPR
ncbi:hypothetical protein, partial [Xanthomonas vasicola]|uniref:hypothetical protein n=1 Tax=Xanthomonas vasicola TaxID=56459 RepID=UPI001D093AC6